MKIIHSIKEFDAGNRFLAVTLGNFDGVHLGHRQLLRAAVEQAAGQGGSSLVCTFEPHPLQVLRREPFARLQQPADKRRAIAALGVDYLLELPFTPELAALSPRDFFVEYFTKELKPDWLTVGYNFSFGAGGRGDAGLLRELGAAYGIETQIEPAFTDGDGKPVSSSRIRSLIGEGRLGQASKLLGRQYQLRGEIVHGRRLGRQLGFPTANILAEPYMVLPAFGVYAAWASCEQDEAVMPAVVNVGLRPTVAANQAPTIETHCLGVERDFYGQTMRIRFVGEIRPEQRFASIEELKSQIAADCLTAADILQKYSK